MQPRTRLRLERAAWFGGAAVLLATVFALYARPGFLVTLVDQIWACF